MDGRVQGCDRVALVMLVTLVTLVRSIALG